MYVYSGPAPWSPAGWRFPWPEWMVLLTVLECWLVMQTITSKTLGLQPVLPHYKQGESTDFPSLNAVWNHLLPSHSLNVSTHVLPHNKKKGEQWEIPLFGHCFEIIFYQTTCSKSPYWPVFQGVWILSWSNLLSPKSITQVFLTNTLCSIAGPNLREKNRIGKINTP